MLVTLDIFYYILLFVICYFLGKKVDHWFMVDSRTGLKEELLNLDSTDETCPLLNRNSMFVGRTGNIDRVETEDFVKCFSFF